MKLFFLLVIAASICPAVFAQSKSINKLTSEFEYNFKLPLDVYEIGVKEQDGVKIHDISYSSLKGGRVTAYLVKPMNKGKFAGMIFLHPGPGNRSTFLDEAISFAKNGAVSLLIDAPFRRPEPWKRTFNPPQDPENERDIYIQMVLDLRRGVDLLLAEKDVDKKRIGFVGHSFGATWGGVLAGLDKRIKVFILIAGRPSLTDWIQTTKDPNVIKLRESIAPEMLKKYLETLAPLDTIRYIGAAPASNLFFQFARQDESVLPEETNRITRLLPNPQAVKWYDANHQGVRTNENAVRDRRQWLNQKLNLKSTAK